MAEDSPTLPTVCPYLLVENPEPVLSFMVAAFGGRVGEVHRRPDRTVQHAEVRIGTSVVMLGSHTPTWPASLYLSVDDVDLVHARALELGATSSREPTNQDYGERSSGLVDPGGITWWLAGPLR